MYSNLRLLDSTNRPKELVDRAIELGLAGIAITDHESLGCHIELDRLQEEYKDKYPDFKIVRGNEIYLTDNRDMGQYYYHFILVALDGQGHKMLRELSSTAWINSYFDRGMERVPTLKSEVEAVVKKYGKGHLHGSAACLAGEINHNLNLMIQAETIGDTVTAQECHDRIITFVQWCKSVFGEDFTLEVAPGRSEEQLAVNTRMSALSRAFGVPIVIGTDAHYLRKEDRFVHKAFLNSKDGEREVDSFYEYTYLQSEDEIRENLEGTGLDYEELCRNSMAIYNKCQYYTLQRNQHVVQVDVPFFPKEPPQEHRYDTSKYPVLDRLTHSDNLQERYWVNACQEALEDKDLVNDTYLSRLEKEADIMTVVGEKLGTCIFAYPNFLQHYMDLIWECGSPIGAGRGSAGAGLNHYLLGLVQVDPLKHDFMYERFLNKDRLELPDVDIDVSPSLRPKILDRIREERGGPLTCVQVCTYGTISTKAAIKSAFRGYRSVECPNGIDLDEAEYVSSLVPSERGFIWSLHDCFFGNEEKDRKPIKEFIKEINKYDGLKDILLNIENLISQRGIHASGVCFYDKDDPFDEACFMKAKDGSIITQWSLHPQEAAGSTKYDFLVTEQMDIIAQCIQELKDHGKIDKNLTLRQAYDKYIHPDVLPMEDKKLWDAIDGTNIVALFQLNSQVGSQTVKKLLPRNIKTLNDCNGIMRLMAGDDGVMPTDRYADMKAHPEKWEAEMDAAGLTPQEKSVIKEYVSCGVLIDQESLMRIVMDDRVCGFSLSESNATRKIVAKKHMDEIPTLHQKILDRATSPAMGKYVWFLMQPSMGYSFD